MRPTPIVQPPGGCSTTAGAPSPPRWSGAQAGLRCSPSRSATRSLATSSAYTASAVCSGRCPHWLERFTRPMRTCWSRTATSRRPNTFASTDSTSRPSTCSWRRRTSCAPISAISRWLPATSRSSRRELGLAAGVHGEAAQAASLGWQLQLVDEAGCAGATVFSWTDEWGVAGSTASRAGISGSRRPIGHRSRPPKWSGSGHGRSIVDVRQTWPLVSVVVCAYNEEATIEQCLASLEASTYPALEVIVCDDGSTDRTLRAGPALPVPRPRATARRSQRGPQRRARRRPR